MILGSNMSVKWPQGMLRTALGVVLIAAGVALLGKADTDLVPYALGVSALAFAGLFGDPAGAAASEVEADPDEQEAMQPRGRRGRRDGRRGAAQRVAHQRDVTTFLRV